MRHALIALVLAACSSPGKTVYVSLATSDVPAGHAALAASDDGVSVIEMRESEIPALSQHEHEDGRCGGFMVHETRADALADLHPARENPVDYTLDRGPVVAAVLPRLDENHIATTIRELSAFPSRYFKSASGVAAATWLRDRWRSFTARPDVTVELFPHAKWDQPSVIMTIPGTTKADEVIVIGGHLDSISMAARASGAAPGADDDASGIATLTEVARVLLAANYHPARTLVFMGYAAEEVGLRGSQDIAAAYKQRGVKVVGALQLDMTAYHGSDKDIWLMKDFTSAPQNAFVQRLIDAYTGATWGLDACGYACSDHASWHRNGVPVSMPFESRMRDRNKKIHTKDDTLETSGNNATHAVKFARLAAAYAIELGKGQLGD
ncbi:MAG: M20/M25/M40 family metallo-hydrolase [Deltaproteobacteria bacterium]|nr:M20/M25/M40 family metallo-hydrolase [Deltaproteobacteria bacterium]